MKYTVKWITENLGITRDMLRYYEKEKLLSSERTRNPSNNYREYAKEDIDEIWAIKLLIGIGFTAKEIRAIMNESNFDFYDAISKKVVELEKKHNENLLYLQFAKSIKATGRIPTVAKLGNIKFDEFLSYARENWNFYDAPESSAFMNATDVLISKSEHKFSNEDLEKLSVVFANIDAQKMASMYTLNGYFQVISDMSEFSFKSNSVQKIIQSLHKYFSNTFLEESETISKEHFARYIAASFIDGDTAVLYERNYGKENCEYIAKAIAWYGGYENIDEL